MVGHVVRLINPGPLFIGLLKLLLAKTDEERALAKKSPAFPYFFFAPIVIFAVLVGLTYSTIAPLMLPFACWFCTVGYVVYRYNFYWVFEPSFEVRKEKKKKKNKNFQLVIPESTSLLKKMSTCACRCLCKPELIPPPVRF
eukprot:m.290624 g.290624  ORF g.290624 m.290624 type:complete len:141 (-) comp19469_c2_seq4:41-463(-)